MGMPCNNPVVFQSLLQSFLSMWLLGGVALEEHLFELGLNPTYAGKRLPDQQKYRLVTRKSFTFPLWGG